MSRQSSVLEQQGTEAHLMARVLFAVPGGSGLCSPGLASLPEADRAEESKARKGLVLIFLAPANSARQIS